MGIRSLKNEMKILNLEERHGKIKRTINEFT